MKIAIAGGGTGGHLFPALAVAETLLERGHEAIIFISEKEIDSLATKGRAEFKFEKLPSVGMPRPFSPAIFGFIKRFNESLKACKSIYQRFRPDAVLGMGGFTSTAPIMAGRKRKLPTFLHESNAIPGKANRWNAKMVTAVFLGFEDCTRHFSMSKCVVTGTPIRRSLGTTLSKAAAREEFRLDPNKTTILVMGGSQGAEGINLAMLNALDLLKDIPIQIIHLTGAAQEQIMTVNYRRAGVPAHVAAFCHQMEMAYSASDLVISRSGAASLSELAHFSLTGILIPYPHAAENHQALNAEIFERHGAAMVLPQEAANGEALATMLRQLLENPRQLETMRERAKMLAPSDAAERVVDTIESYLK